jgi:hypothetical protein
LSSAGKDLVVPLDVVQDRGGDGSRASPVELRCAHGGHGLVRRDKPELGDHRGFQSGSELCTHREPVTGPHRHAKEANPQLVDRVILGQDRKGREPIALHVLVNGQRSCGDHLLLVRQRPVAEGGPVSVERAVNGQGGDSVLHEAMGQTVMPFHALVPGSAVTQQDDWGRPFVTA